MGLAYLFCSVWFRGDRGLDGPKGNIPYKCQLLLSLEIEGMDDSLIDSVCVASLRPRGSMMRVLVGGKMPMRPRRPVWKTLFICIAGQVVVGWSATPLVSQPSWHGDAGLHEKRRKEEDKEISGFWFDDIKQHLACPSNQCFVVGPTKQNTIIISSH
jgi:hypothetical protein